MPKSIGIHTVRKTIAARIFIAMGILWCSSVMAIEEPKYELISSERDFEIRHYTPILIAETHVDGDMDEATNKGFRRIADFIFGNNQASTAELKTKIEMTAPVTVEPKTSKISMTAPVTVVPQNESTNMIKTSTWRIYFVMPSQYTLDSIPKPNNVDVKLREIPEKYFLVLRYSGLNTVARVQQKIDDAILWAQKKSLTIIGRPQLSRYDPPWTLPMFRRNEIMIEISAPQ